MLILCQNSYTLLSQHTPVYKPEGYSAFDNVTLNYIVLMLCFFGTLRQSGLHKQWSLGQSSVIFGRPFVQKIFENVTGKIDQQINIFFFWGQKINLHMLAF